MQTQDRKAWMEKNLRLNADMEIKVGMEVKDAWGQKGVVVKIVPPEDANSHGTIFVWQSERLEYGADNCEHYSTDTWKSLLRITVNPYESTPSEYHVKLKM